MFFSLLCYYQNKSTHFAVRIIVETRDGFHVLERFFDASSRIVFTIVSLPLYLHLLVQFYRRSGLSCINHRLPKSCLYCLHWCNHGICLLCISQKSGSSASTDFDHTLCRSLHWYIHGLFILCINHKVSEVLPVHIIHCVNPYIGTFVEYVSCVLITKFGKSCFYISYIV